MRLLVEDIWVVPDYMTFYHSSIDGNLSQLQKGENTQHQWRFEAAVAISYYHPTGAKVMYQKYCSDKVVIIEKRGKLQCVSKVGKLTGGADLATSYLIMYYFFFFLIIVAIILLLSNNHLNNTFLLLQDWSRHLPTPVVS